MSENEREKERERDRNIVNEGGEQKIEKERGVERWRKEYFPPVGNVLKPETTSEDKPQVARQRTPPRRPR